MNPNKRLETWIWISIYGGLLAFSLGWFVEARSVPVGLALMIGGALAAAAGVGMVYLRSRRGDAP